MRHEVIAPIAALLLLASAASVRADIPVDPEPRPRRPVVEEAPPLAIRIDAKAERATLKIPSRFLPKSEGRRGAKAGAALPGLRTIVAGLALSAAAVGAFFVRRGGKGRAPAMAAIVAAAACVGIFGIWSAAEANIAPFPDREPSEQEPPIIREVTEEATLAKGRIKIEVVPTGEAVLLVLPESYLPQKGDAPPGAAAKE
jgi:hypothetical protein